MLESSPPMGGSPCGRLLTTRTATAPAFCAFFTFSVKKQLPRSTTAILPAISAALTSASQPRFGASDPSRTTASSPVTPTRSTGGPNWAVCTA